MKKIKLILFIIVSQLLLVACTSFGFISQRSEYFETKHGGYSLLSDSEKTNIVFLMAEDTLPIFFDSTKFYAISALHLKDYLSKYDSCLIYIWNDLCGASLCFSPLVYQQYCNIHGYKFVFIPRGYYYVQFVQNFNTNVDYPYFCINSFYYKKANTRNYLYAFEKDLFGKKEFGNLKYTDKWARLWIYKEGKFYEASKQLIMDFNELESIANNTKTIKTNRTIIKSWKWEKESVIK
ncbi:MAG: hypothetical protein LBG80_06120 [Bacteroidales bacterium]|jgi:hypothetical protein|nr:hypothetical protein [Bacteroidales bacterium]